ncbi:MAG: AI-2E family transporter [Theionarchaea archaeon]|nr:AI-2E family transporter [Theionarchaea archaeon]
MFDKKLLSTLLVFAGILLVIFLLRPLLPAFCLALVLIYVTKPLTTFLQKYVKMRFPATVASFLIIIGLFAILTLLLVGELRSELARLPAYLKDQDFYSSLNLFQQISGSELIRNLLTQNGLQIIVKIAVQLGNALLQIFFGLLISFVVVWKDVRIPVSDENIKKILSIIDRGITSVVLSLILTAIVTGIISIPIYYFFDLPYPLFLATLTGFLTLLPVIGAWLLYIPVSGYLLLSEGFVNGFAFLILCAIFISTLPDILVRPIAGRTREVGAIPLLIGFTSGLMVFGISGIIVGPLIVIAAIAFYQVYFKSEMVNTGSREG